MNTFNYIKENGWDALTSELFIKVKLYKEGLAKLNYDQVRSPKTHPVVIECRALILSYPDAHVVSAAFPRFFNYGEALDVTKHCDLTNSDFYEKADGSLIQVYFCLQTKRWEIATRGMAFAEGPDNFSGDTFRMAVLKAMGNWDENKFQTFCDKLNEQLTYVFEYCGPSNRIITEYETDHLVLLSIIENSSGKEFTNRVPDCVNLFKVNWNMNVRAPMIFNFENETQMLGALHKLENREEGFVAKDKTTGVRVKIKSPKYVILHHLRGNNSLSPDRIAELIVSNEVDEYLSCFSGDASKFIEYQNTWDNFKKDLIDSWEMSKNTPSQKDFAQLVKKYPFSGLLFSARKHNIDIIEELNNSNTDYKSKLLLQFHLENKYPQ